MAHAIICGHCPDRHATALEVRDCWEWEAEAERGAGEVCCFSCDGLIGWRLPRWTDEVPLGCGGPGICKRDFPATFGDF